MRGNAKWLVLPVLLVGIVWAGAGAAGIDPVSKVRGKVTQTVISLGSKSTAKTNVLDGRSKSTAKSDATDVTDAYALEESTSKAAGKGQAPADKGLAQAIAQTSEKQTQASNGLTQAGTHVGIEQAPDEGVESEPVGNGGAGAVAKGKQSTAGELSPKEVTQLIESKAAVIIAQRYAAATNFKSRDVKVRRLDGGAAVSGRGSFLANGVTYDAAFLGTISDGNVLLSGLDARDPEAQGFASARKQKGAVYNTGLISTEGKVGVTELSTQWQNGTPSTAFSIGTGGQKTSGTQATFNSSLMGSTANRIGGQVQVVVWPKSK